jgi:hypothetical protein
MQAKELIHTAVGVKEVEIVYRLGVSPNFRLQWHVA